MLFRSLGSDDLARPFAERLARAGDAATLDALDGVGRGEWMRERIEHETALGGVCLGEGLGDGLRKRCAEALERSRERRGLDGCEREDPLSRITQAFFLTGA